MRISAQMHEGPIVKRSDPHALRFANHDHSLSLRQRTGLVCDDFQKSLVMIQHDVTHAVSHEFIIRVASCRNRKHDFKPFQSCRAEFATIAECGSLRYDASCEEQAYER